MSGVPAEVPGSSRVNVQHNFTQTVEMQVRESGERMTTLSIETSIAKLRAMGFETITIGSPPALIWTAHYWRNFQLRSMDYPFLADALGFLAAARDNGSIGSCWITNRHGTRIAGDELSAALWAVQTAGEVPGARHRAERQHSDPDDGFTGAGQPGGTVPRHSSAEPQ